MAPTIGFRPASEGVNPQQVPGAYFTGLVEITGDGAYPAGGYAFGVAQLQAFLGGAATLIAAVDVVNNWITTAGGGTTAFMATYARGSGKVQAFKTGSALSTAFIECAGADITSSFTTTLRVWYR